MARLIDREGRCRYDEAQHQASFAALTRSIVYQQLSGKAAGTIYRRLTAAIGRRQPNPRSILDADPDALRAAGLSRQKVAYIIDLAEKVDSGVVSLRRLRFLHDEEVIGQLTQVQGIGRWTVHMFLMFHLGRLDVLPVGDLGIRSGFRDVYGLGELPDPATMETIAAPWAPYRSIGSWYLWRSQDGEADSILPAVGRLSWAQLTGAVAACRICSRLVAHRERMGREKRAAFRDQEYWGRAVPGFGDRRARLLIVGLAPAAHGANRTGRMFTGDRSGDWLYRALCRAGFANQPQSTGRGDGLELHNAYVTAGVRCAPPDNKPTTGERDACRPFLDREIDLLDEGAGIRCIVPLGQFAYDQTLRIYRERGYRVPRPKPRFAHGAEVELGVSEGVAPVVLASFHPSQQNTFTGRLTEAMLDKVFSRARELVAG